MKKVLLIATVQSHIAQFHKPLIKLLRKYGCEVHVAARDNLNEKNGLALPNVDQVFNIPFSRSPLSTDNIKAYRQLKGIIKGERYDVICCNTPVGGVLGRIAARKYRKAGTKVIYVAHGFHFYGGAPKKNWIVYYPIEKLLAHFTDKLITICEEDHKLASEKFKCQVCRIHGVGVDADRYYPINETEKQSLKRELGFDAESRLILCVGELLPNKNQTMAIRAMADVVKEIPQAVLLIAGNGSDFDRLNSEADSLSLTNSVKFLGYVTNLEKYQQISDISVSCSKREGLPLNIIEAMLTANPVVVTKNRGHCELVDEGKNGFLVDVGAHSLLSNRIISLLNDEDKRVELGLYGRNFAQLYSSDKVISELREIYADVL